MINIAICDDEIEYQNIIKEKVEGVFTKEKEEYATFLYASGKEMLEAANGISFDIVLLDIDMPEESGLIVADDIVDKLPRTNVVFITNRDDLVYEALKCTPFSFIRKACLEDLTKPLVKLIHKVRKENYVIVFSDYKQNISLSVFDIYYIESEKHYINIYTKEQMYKLRLKLSECEEQTKGCGFLKIHKSYLVNVRKIKTLTSKKVELYEGITLPISRGNEEKVKTLFLQEAEKHIDGVIV